MLTWLRQEANHIVKKKRNLILHSVILRHKSEWKQLATQPVALRQAFTEKLFLLFADKELLAALHQCGSFYTWQNEYRNIYALIRW